MTSARIARSGLILLSLLCSAEAWPGGPPVPYVPPVPTCGAYLQTAVGPDEQGLTYRCLPDLAEVEAAQPLTTRDLQAIDEVNLTTADQEQIDQIYARLTAGSLPEGEYAIDLFGLERLLELKKLFDRMKLDIEHGIAGFLPSDMPVVTLLHHQMSVIRQVTNEDGVKDFLQSFRNTFVPRKTFARDTLGDGSQQLQSLTIIGTDPQEHPLMKNVFMKWQGISQQSPLKLPIKLFPAKVYCGQSLLDARRESIVIDYAFSETLPEYARAPHINAFFGPRGLQIRDEMRMVRPGLYLGRVYMGRFHTMNFVLFRKELMAAGGPRSEACWLGTQQTPLVTPPVGTPVRLSSTATEN